MTLEQKQIPNNSLTVVFNTRRGGYGGEGGGGTQHVYSQNMYMHTRANALCDLRGARVGEEARQPRKMLGGGGRSID